MRERGNLPELIVTSAFLQQINDSELDDGEFDDGELDDRELDDSELDDMNLTMVGLMIAPLFMTMWITKVQQAANQQYGPLAILPGSLTKSQ